MHSSVQWKVLPEGTQAFIPLGYSKVFFVLPLRQADSTREALGAKLQSALHEEMGLLERVQQLEAVKTTLEAKVAALQEGQGEAVLRLSAQLTSGESERADLQKTVVQQRAENEKVCLPNIYGCFFGIGINAWIKTIALIFMHSLPLNLLSIVSRSKC